MRINLPYLEKILINIWFCGYYSQYRNSSLETALFQIQGAHGLSRKNIGLQDNYSTRYRTFWLNYRTKHLNYRIYRTFSKKKYRTNSFFTLIQDKYRTTSQIIEFIGRRGHPVYCLYLNCFSFQQDTADASSWTDRDVDPKTQIS